MQSSHELAYIFWTNPQFLTLSCITSIDDIIAVGCESGHILILKYIDENWVNCLCLVPNTLTSCLSLVMTRPSSPELLGISYSTLVSLHIDGKLRA